MKQQSRHILRSLRHRNYQLFFAGQLISLIGTWMQSLAMSWLVYRMTNSPFALGVIGFSSQISAFFVTPFAGVWADHANRRKLVILTQTLAMVQALALAVLVFLGAARVWHIVFLSVFLGLVNSFDMPVRQSFTVDMIEDKEDLGNAIALNSMIFNSARFIGPPIAGAVVALWGEGICFLLNGISYIAVIIALMMMHIPHLTHRTRPDSVLKSMREGFVYTINHKPIRSIILLMGMVSLVVFPYAILMPVFARDVLHGTSQTLGFLLGAIGVGAFGGATYMASREGIGGIGKRLAAATAAMGSGIIILSFVRSLGASLAILLLVGFGMMVTMASCNTFLQTVVEDKMRGRVMGFYVMAFVGLTPFGSLFAGWLASRIGTPYTIMIAGILCVCAALVFSVRLGQFERFVNQHLTGA
ncbi:MAG: MFS transporter [Deltaproteobacteria bacterium]